MLREAARKGAAECIELLQDMVGENNDTSEAGPPLDNTWQALDLDDIGDFDFLGGWDWDDAAVARGFYLDFNFTATGLGNISG
ncbi:hypothetical protein NW754_003799 [Fusarium falciforme]|uniref:Uncharacterized protein n=1 Tax=Fusarium falciforme TaxID=195108 RepID=A0A9W8UTG7_9HYPO|nr:hypothetical protein NW754_003799 [Fusarium falciforme]KAJ4177347.1 hypothetical protein NW755_013898 [Fusarium falciforme]KAJ4239580.1 hypothetical protein NW757_012601 [Fusarium falciforme]